MAISGLDGPCTCKECGRSHGGSMCEEYCHQCFDRLVAEGVIDPDDYD
jgi:hypothetical protein